MKGVGSINYHSDAVWANSSDLSEIYTQSRLYRVSPIPRSIGMLHLLNN